MCFLNGMEQRNVTPTIHTHTQTHTFNHRKLQTQVISGFLSRQSSDLLKIEVFCLDITEVFKNPARAVQQKYNLQYQRNIGILCVVLQKLKGCDFIRTLLLKDHRVTHWHFELHLNLIYTFNTTFMFHHKLTLDRISHYCHCDCTWTSNGKGSTMRSLAKGPFSVSGSS